MTAVPLVYEEIKQDLLGRIGRQWAEGDRLPAASQLARDIGAGQRNTLRAMQELVREGYLRSRPGRGTFVTRKLPRSHAGARRTRRPSTDTRLLILLSPTGQDGFMLDIARAIDAAVAEQGIRAEFRIAEGNYDLRRPPYADFDAFAILNPDQRRIHLLEHQKAVVISTTNVVRIEALRGFDVVSVEEEHGAYLAGQRLREAGHAAACFLGVRHKSTPDVTDITSAVRLRGFEAGFGKAVDPAHLLWGTAYSHESGAMALARYLAIPDRPRAVFAASDDLAIGFALGSLTMGVMPGRDFDLIGFDGQHRGRSMAECPPLTSVAIPSVEMGRRASQLLVERMRRPDKPVERILLGCSLFTGGTVQYIIPS